MSNERLSNYLCGDHNLESEARYLLEDSPHDESAVLPDARRRVFIFPPRSSARRFPECPRASERGVPNERRRHDGSLSLLLVLLGIGIIYARHISTRHVCSVCIVSYCDCIPREVAVTGIHGAKSSRRLPCVSASFGRCSYIHNRLRHASIFHRPGTDVR